MSTLSELKWFKSSFSEASGNACVEVAVHDDERVAIRHSVFPARGFSVRRSTFTSLVNAVQSGSLISDRKY
ncbi:DUF397 domain-containing protein [Streptomyces sp. AC512_CC834]|uniref:DUF397 domain-containing protein n=1 Tax=Streptomyces sp. AC512_CC834 TaxID=2823691 RepID=UPI001C279A09|nr:DUF397 domain-containing protein [Streptomyces sp. AC512_CC834]